MWWRCDSDKYQYYAKGESECDTGGSSDRGICSWDAMLFVKGSETWLSHTSGLGTRLVAQPRTPGIKIRDREAKLQSSFNRWSCTSNSSYFFSHWLNWTPLRICAGLKASRTTWSFSPWKINYNTIVYQIGFTYFLREVFTIDVHLWKRLIERDNTYTWFWTIHSCSLPVQNIKENKVFFWW